MNRSALRILSEVARTGEVSLYTAICMGAKAKSEHRGQYPLALLLEGHYLGMTISYSPPGGAELMREYALAITLYMYLLPSNAGGEIQYLGVRSTGSLDPKNEKVFLTALGALYLDEYRQKRKDRLLSTIFGFLTGLLVALGAAWVKHLFAW